MRCHPDDPGQRFFETARWYLPPLAGEPEPDPTLACTYALLAVYAKLDSLIDALSTAGSNAQANPDATADLRATVHTLEQAMTHDSIKLDRRVSKAPRAARRTAPLR